VAPPPIHTRDELLGSTIRELDSLCLSMACGGCPKRVALPCRMLARRAGALRLRDVLPRLRCETCGGRPPRVLVVSYPAGPPQYPDTWQVEVYRTAEGESYPAALFFAGAPFLEGSRPFEGRRG
jgi:hypothetical protein